MSHVIDIEKELSTLPVEKKIAIPYDLLKRLLPVITELVLATLKLRPARLVVEGKLETIVRVEDSYGSPLLEVKITPMEIELKMSESVRQEIGQIVKEVLAKLRKPIKEEVVEEERKEERRAE